MDFSKTMGNSIFLQVWMVSLWLVQVMSSDSPGLDSQLEARQSLFGSPLLNPSLAAALNPLSVGLPSSLPLLQQQLLSQGLGGLSNYGDVQSLAEMQALAELQGLPQLQGLQDPQNSLLKRIGPLGLPNRLGGGFVSPRALGLSQALLPGLRGGLGGIDSLRGLLGLSPLLGADGTDRRVVSNPLQFSDRNQLRPQSGFASTFPGENNRNEEQELSELLASLQRSPQNGLFGTLAPNFGLRRLSSPLQANPFLGRGSRFFPVQRKGLEFDDENDGVNRIGAFERGFTNVNSRQQDVDTDSSEYFIFPN